MYKRKCVDLETLSLRTVVLWQAMCRWSNQQKKKKKKKRIPYGPAALLIKLTATFIFSPPFCFFHPPPICSHFWFHPDTLSSLRIATNVCFQLATSVLRTQQGCCQKKTIMPLIWLSDSNGRWLMNGRKRGRWWREGGRRREEAWGWWELEWGWTIPEFSYLSRSERISTLHYSPPFCRPPLLFTLLLSPPGISLSLSGHEDWAYMRMHSAKEGDEPCKEGSWGGWKVGDVERKDEERHNLEAGEWGKVWVQRQVCCNRTVEHIALGTRLLLLQLQMVGRRFQLIYVSL